MIILEITLRIILATGWTIVLIVYAVGSLLCLILWPFAWIVGRHEQFRLWWR